jgi:MFS family permease
MVRRPHPAWIVLAVTFFALLAGADIRATPSGLIVPPEEEFGWTRSTISLAISLNIFLYGLMGPFAGGLMQRPGIRRTTVGALTTTWRSGARARSACSRRHWRCRWTPAGAA